MTAEDLDLLHWHTLKAMVEKAGGKYENKAQAVAFLAGGQVLQEHVSGVFDKSQPYGQIFGEIDGYHGAVYSQGGCLFNALGDKLDGQVDVS